MTFYTTHLASLNLILYFLLIKGDSPLLEVRRRSADIASDIRLEHCRGTSFHFGHVEIEILIPAMKQRFHMRLLPNTLLGQESEVE